MTQIASVKACIDVTNVHRCFGRGLQERGFFRCAREIFFEMFSFRGEKFRDWRFRGFVIIFDFLSVRERERERERETSWKPFSRIVITSFQCGYNTSRRCWTSANTEISIAQIRPWFENVFSTSVNPTIFFNNFNNI